MCDLGDEIFEQKALRQFAVFRFQSSCWNTSLRNDQCSREKISASRLRLSLGSSKLKRAVKSTLRNWYCAQIESRQSFRRKHPEDIACVHVGSGVLRQSELCALEKTGKLRFLIRRFQYYSVWKLKHIIFLFLAQNFELFGCKIDKIKTLIQFYLCDDPTKMRNHVSRFFWAFFDWWWCSRCVSAAPCCWIRVRARSSSASMLWCRTSCWTTIAWSDSTIATSTVHWIVIWILKWLRMPDCYRSFSREDVSVIKWPQ